MLVVFFLFAFFMIDSYEVRNAELWAKSLNDLIKYVDHLLKKNVYEENIP